VKLAPPTILLRPLKGLKNWSQKLPRLAAIEYLKIPTTNHQPPTTNHQPPTTNHQRPLQSEILTLDAARENSLQPQARLSPAAPLWTRAAAFALDVGALALLFYLPWAAAPDWAIQCAPTAVWWQLGIGWLYFALLNGPAGRGVTVGKLVFDIRCLRPDKTPLTLAQGMARAGWQLLPFVLMGAAAEFLEPHALTIGPTILSLLLFYLGMGLLSGNIAHMVSHPLKQGWHDRVADSINARQPAGAALDAAIRDVARHRKAISQRAFQTALFATIIVSGMSSCEVGTRYNQLNNPAYRENAEFAEDIRQTTKVLDQEPRLGFPMGELDAADGLTTATLVLAYDFRGPAPRELKAADLEEAARRLLARWNEKPEEFQRRVFREAPDRETGAERFTEFVQIREAELSAWESYPIFGQVLRRPVVEKRTIEFRFPPDHLVKPRELEAEPALEVEIIEAEESATPALEASETPSRAPQSEEASESREPAGAEAETSDAPESVAPEGAS
jgi:uncharacterized RDD family membrane protein YckC